MAEVNARAGAAPDAERAIDWAQVRLILSARWRLVIRGLSKNVLRLVLTAVVWTAVAGFLVAITVGAGLLVAALRADPARVPLTAAALHVAFLFSLVSLTVTPALGLRGNEFLDVTKLFTLPVSHRTVFAASLLGLVLSPSALFLTLPLAGAVVGWGGGPVAVAGGLLAVAGLALAGTALGQIGLLLFLDLFRSRKWRDVSRLVVVLLSAGVYTSTRFLAADAFRDGVLAGLAAADRLKDWALPLPSWWAAHAVTGTGVLRWVPALALVPLVLWLVAVAARLQERAWFGEIEERHDVSSGPSRGIASWVGRRLRGTLGGVVEKDVRLLLRDPTIRIVLIQQLAYSVAPLAMAMLGSSRRGQFGSPGTEAVLAGVALLPPLLSTSLAFNPLGTEGAGVQHALLGPTSRTTIVRSKVLALMIVVGSGLAALCGVGTLVVCLTVGHLGTAASIGRAVLAAIEAPAAFAVFAGGGAALGARFPIRILTRDRRALRQVSSSAGGCLGTIVRIAATAACLLLCLPIALAFHHPAIAGSLGERAFDSTPWLSLSVPLAVLYAAFLVWAGSRIGGAALAAREEEVLDTLTRAG